MAFKYCNIIEIYNRIDDVNYTIAKYKKEQVCLIDVDKTNADSPHLFESCTPQTVLIVLSGTTFDKFVPFYERVKDKPLIVNRKYQIPFAIHSRIIFFL
ncbi:MAG: hypothetical protein WCJ03_03980 [Bacteroidales bacterium]